MTHHIRSASHVPLLVNAKRAAAIDFALNIVALLALSYLLAAGSFNSIGSTAVAFVFTGGGAETETGIGIDGGDAGRDAGGR